jgi:hypothetical protein
MAQLHTQYAFGSYEKDFKFVEYIQQELAFMKSEDSYKDKYNRIRLKLQADPLFEGCSIPEYQALQRIYRDKIRVRVRQQYAIDEEGSNLSAIEGRRNALDDTVLRMEEMSDQKEQQQSRKNKAKGSSDNEAEAKKRAKLNAISDELKSPLTTAFGESWYNEEDEAQNSVNSITLSSNSVNKGKDAKKSAPRSPLDIDLTLDFTAEEKLQSHHERELQKSDLKLRTEAQASEIEHRKAELALRTQEFQHRAEMELQNTKMQQAMITMMTTLTERLSK